MGASKHTEKVEENEEFIHILHPHSTTSTVYHTPQPILMYTQGLSSNVGKIIRPQKFKTKGKGTHPVRVVKEDQTERVKLELGTEEMPWTLMGGKEEKQDSFHLGKDMTKGE